jgi:AraC family transcriptional regulator, regulatory protein of adaptative response / methylated-DNA-[protein]-cysteine methyltransferase
MMINATQIDEAQAWQQLLARDPAAEFLYGVTTTGVFCRPGCASRQPLRENTRFFSTTAEARGAGFRACQRCKPEQPAQASAVARMCAFIENHIARGLERPVRLAELGRHIGLSPFTAQRLFKQAMGVSPVAYQRALKANALREQLTKGTSVTDAIYEAGYSSSSRAYESTPLGMTPGRFLAGGRGETIRYAAVDCSQASQDAGLRQLGWIIVGSTDRGICWLALGATAAEVEDSLRTEFPAATLVADPAIESTVAQVLEHFRDTASSAGSPLPIDLRGTAFQLRVWKALQQIPAGETVTYSQLAAQLGNPAATRAVARACALNRVSVMVPCHRVVGVSGSLTGYRWGVDRKRQLLAAERVT